MEGGIEVYHWDQKNIIIGGGPRRDADVSVESETTVGYIEVDSIIEGGSMT